MLSVCEQKHWLFTWTSLKYLCLNYRHVPFFCYKCVCVCLCVWAWCTLDVASAHSIHFYYTLCFLCLSVFRQERSYQWRWPKCLYPVGTFAHNVKLLEAVFCLFVCLMLVFFLKLSGPVYTSPDIYFKLFFNLILIANILCPRNQNNHGNIFSLMSISICSDLITVKHQARADMFKISEKTFIFNKGKKAIIVLQKSLAMLFLSFNIFAMYSLVT